MSEKAVYRSPNGDDWFVSKDAISGSVSVTHRPNPSSGGSENTMPADEFLQRGGGGPEVQAVRDAVEKMKS